VRGDQGGKEGKIGFRFVKDVKEVGKGVFFYIYHTLNPFDFFHETAVKECERSERSRPAFEATSFTRTSFTKAVS